MKLFSLLLVCWSFYIAQAQRYPIIPKPQRLVERQGSFVFNPKTSFYSIGSTPELQLVMKTIQQKIRQQTALSLTSTKQKRHNQIRVVFDSTIASNEGYILDIQLDKILIKAKSKAGFFYASQSLYQLFSSEKTKTPSLPACLIEDAPRFAYRGIMLDVSRHFMPIDFLKKYIDELAALKFNRFHWHLTDGQAFRFESKKYPLLHLAKSPQWPTNEGFYTQAQMKALVQYAAERCITIIPEIDVPAHSNAALVAYPQYACVDSTGQPQLKQGEFCPKETSITFVKEILDEVMDVFPSREIHIGGDEASKTAWRTCPNCQLRMKQKGFTSLEQLQSDFITALEKHLYEHGRQMIGWDEILEGGLPPRATVMAWRSIENGLTAAQLNHPVVMSPTSHCYLDYYQSEDPNEPLAFGGFINLPKIYSFEPVPAGVSSQVEALILGGQANLWTEQVPVGSHAEYMTFPRAIALAEVDWSAKESRNYDDFIKRLGTYLTHLDARKVNYAKHFYEIKTSITQADGKGVLLSLQSNNNNAPIYYTLDGSSPTTASAVYRQPILLQKSTLVKAATVMQGKMVDEITRTFNYNQATGKTISLRTSPDGRYNKGGKQALTNGVWGGNSRFSDDEWLGWNGLDFEGVIDLGQPTEITQAHLRFFHKPSSWIWIPSQVSIWGSTDGTNFMPLTSQQLTPPTREGVVSLDVRWQAKAIQYVKIVAQSYGTIPPNMVGAGDKPWLFVDEIGLE